MRQNRDQSQQTPRGEIWLRDCLNRLIPVSRGGRIGWGGRDRTSEWRNQNPLPYRLATPQQRRFL